MAHNLLIEDGKAAMMYVRQVPWHGLGTRLESPPTSAEAIKAAQLDWRVKKVPLYAVQDTGILPVPHRYAVVPENRWGKPDCPVFGVVGEDYTPLQNAEAFAFFDAIVGEKLAMYETAGALGDGERVWVLAKLPGEIQVVGDDIAHKYLLLANGHDGNTSVQMKFTTIRVVCQNTLSWALDTGHTVSVHHGYKFGARMKNATEALGIIDEQFAKVGAECQKMAKVKMNGLMLTSYLTVVFPDPSKPNERSKQQIARHRDECARLFEVGPGNAEPPVKGTLWAAFNGVTDYVDHFWGDYKPQQRLQSVWFGKGSQIKARAYQGAQRLLTGVR